MSKNHETQKNLKKAAQKTWKEKRAEKREKKALKSENHTNLGKVLKHD